MSHFTLLVQFSEEETNKILNFDSLLVRDEAIMDLLEEKLLPFKEGMEGLPEKHKEFCVQATLSELEHEFKTKKFEVLKDYNGKILDCSEKTYLEYYVTLDNFIRSFHGYKEHEGQYGYWYNPNAHWDWFTVGGRWAGALNYVAGGIGGLNQQNLANRIKYKDLYGELDLQIGSADWCLVKDLNFALCEEKTMKEIDIFLADYSKFIAIENKKWEEYTPEEKEFSNNNFFFGETLCKLGIRSLVQGKQPLYNEDGIPMLDPNTQIHLFSEAIFKDIPFDKEYLLNKKYLFDFSTYAILTETGEWVSPGEMGWFGISNEPSDSYDLFKKNYKELAFKNPNIIVCVVDCHI